MVRVYWRLRAGTAFQKAPEGLTQGEYWLRYTENGKQRWKKVGSWGGVKKAAQLLERELQRQRVAKQYDLQAPSTEKRLSVPEGITNYISRKVLAGKRPATIASYQNTLKIFKEWCPRLYVDEITGDDLLAFAAHCRKRGDGDRTAAKRFVDVMSFMKFCGRPKLVPKNDWPKYTERLVEAYTQKELDDFYAAVKTDKEKVLLDLLIHTGFRNGEIAHLTWDDVNLGNQAYLVELLPMAAYAVRAPDGVIAWFNSRATELWGRVPVIGDTDERFCGVHKLYHADGSYMAHGDTPVALALNTGASVHEEEVVIERPGGSRVTVSVHIDPSHPYRAYYSRMETSRSRRPV